MASSPTQVGMSAVTLNDEEDTFERDLKEMLKEGPSLNDMSSTVQSGKPQAYIKPDGHAASASNLPTATSTGIPRSHSVPPATSNIPLSSPERNGDFVFKSNNGKASTLASGASKLESLKQWSFNTYKCTKQMISERFGKGTKTVDLELEAQIEALRDTQRKYANILRLARALSNHFYHVVQTQRALGEAFSEMSQKSPELQEEFSYNSETQKALCKNGETLLGALNFFTSSVNTLCNKTMEDTIMTIKSYEASRVEFDAYRTDVETLQLAPRDTAMSPKLDDAQRKYAAHKVKYDKLRADVAIKLKFLEENKVNVTRKQLYLFYQAFTAYISGNNEALVGLLRSYNIQNGDQNCPPGPAEIPTPPAENTEENSS